MFVFILFGQEKLIKQVRSEIEQQRMLIARLEQRLAQSEQAGHKPKAAAIPPVGMAGVTESLSLKEVKNPVGVQDGGLDLFMAPPQR